MSVAIRAATRIQDMDDANVSLGVGVDEYVLTYDHDTARFVLRAPAAPFAGILATGATVGATAQAQAFEKGLSVGGTYNSTYDRVEAAIFLNATDKNYYTYLQSGLTTDQKVYLAFRDYTGALQWYFGKDQVNDIILFHSPSIAHRLRFTPNADTLIDSGGVSPVTINGGNYADSGTGGLLVKSGTATPTTYALINSAGLTLSGNIDLSAISNATTGTITRGGTRFIHGFKHPTGGGAVPVGNNTFVGLDSGNFTMGSTAVATYQSSLNVGVGNLTLSNNTLGWQNVAVGSRSMLSTTTGTRNAAVGAYALGGNTTGEENVGVGYQSLNVSAAANYNTAVGSRALIAATGDRNVAIGAFAGTTQTTASENVFIGYSAGYYETGSNRLFIDNTARASEADARAKALIYGIFSATTANQKLTFNAKVGINDTAPAEELDVTGNINTTGVVKVDDVQVLSNRVIDVRAADVANSGDATTDGLIDALRDAMIAHGLIAAA